MTNQEKQPNPTFQKNYTRLNPQQKIAVDTIDGPVMVMAGPGTGKTQVLATRVANILNTQDINPQNILALTFTDAAAQNMRERIVDMIGTDGFYVNIMTFHAFASEVISQYPEEFPIEKGSEPLSDFERFQIFETIILNTKLEFLKSLNDPLHYIKAVISQISNLKREYITPLKFETILEAEETQLELAVEEYWALQQEKTTVGKKAKTKLSGALLKETKNLNKQKELLVLYIKYLSELKIRKRYDFDDMISFVVDAFENNPDLLLDYQERFQYILVDEYQDTNASQNKIVELLVSFWADMDLPPNIFVVGDPHQSIFRFQGASTENMLKFIDTYPNVTVVTLATGYRCSQQVYSAAHDLIANNTLNFKMVNSGSDQLNEQGSSQLNNALSQKLEAFKGAGEDITVFAAESETLQLLYLAEEIKKLEQSGVALQDIAVLYKTNKEATLIKEILEKWGINYELSVGGNVFDDLMIQQLLNFFKVIQSFGTGKDNDDLFTVMQYSWLGLEALDVYRLAKIASKLRTSVDVVLEKDFDSVVLELEKKSGIFKSKSKVKGMNAVVDSNVDSSSSSHTNFSYGLTSESFQTLVNFKNKMLSWYSLSNNVLFHEWFSLIINADNKDQSDSKKEPKPNGFSFMQHVLSQPVKTDHLYAINSLYSEVKKFVNQKKDFNLDDFINTIEVMNEHGVIIKIEDLSITKNRVSLSSAHSSKGKEWDYVFIFSLADKKWGNARKRELIKLPDSILLNTDIDQKEKNEDDRRLFYVALTRSIKKTYLLWSQTKANGKQVMNSMFLNEIDKQTTDVGEKEAKALLKKSEGLLEKILTTTNEPIKTYTDNERAFFEHLVSEFKLSVTALNNYLSDPHEFMINSLLRVPRAKSPILSFGTAAHFALEQFYSKLINGGVNLMSSYKIMSKKDFIQQFEYALLREQLTGNDFEERKKHGQKVLEFYYDEVLDPKNYSESNPLKAPLFVEKFFGGKLNKAVLLDGQTEIQLSGRIDRVELLDKHLKTIRVVDYKTGKPKSANVINGQSSIDDYSDREKELPETIRGRYQRQLVFYKLLSELDKTFPYKVTHAEFDFVEPGGTHKDKHIVRSFEVSDQAVTDLKGLIIEVMKEIRELEFLEEQGL